MPLKNNPGLKLEIGGHADSIGGNIKPQGRAKNRRVQLVKI